MLFKKLLRTAWKYKAQFLSMIIMVAIGIGVFVGFNIEWYSIDRNTSDFFGQTNFADFRVYSDAGFSEQDLAAIESIDGVKSAARVLTVNVNVKDSTDSLSLFCIENHALSNMLVTKGVGYDENNDGFWLSDKYAAANGIALGDTITVSYLNVDLSGEVVGLIKSSEYLICVADENQLMPDYSTFGYFYVAPSKVFGALGRTIYTQINILSDLGKTQMESAVSSALRKTTLVLSKDENYSYAGAQSEKEEGQTMGSVLPVLFLLIGILTMVTTMHRITANEKTQIGTLKALGFKDRRILRHYTSYGLVIGIVGALLGIAIGFGIAAVIMNPNGMMGTYFDMPYWKLYMPWYCWLVMALTVAFLTLISFLSVMKMLSGTAADALRPYTPKKMKPLVMERTRAWDKLSFAAKWNIRDVFRHKSRSVMTLIGVIGCMILLVGGLGMKDTMTEFLDLIDTKLYNYETRVNFTETSTNEEILEFAASVDGDLLASSNVSLDGEAVTLEIYDITHDKIRFANQNNDVVSLGDEGVYICIRLSDKYSVGQNIEISPYGSDVTYTVKVAGILRSVLTENIVLTREYAQTIGIPYKYNAVFTDTPQDEILLSGKQTKEAIMRSYDSFMEVMNTMVAMLIVAAVVLGVVVLYNLGVMSYVERYRELATLKVVGFKDGSIGKILISQNIWLTIIGVLLGLPAGVGVLYVLLLALAGEYELELVVGALSYIVSILLTFGVSLVIGFFVARKNRKIDMVESLKGAE